MTLHNIVGTITLLLTLLASVALLVTARTQVTANQLLLRGALISVSLQFLLGALLVLVAFVAFGVSYAAQYWLHYLLGFISVGVVSAVTARGRRAPDAAARRFGATMLGVALLVLVTFLVGELRPVLF